jgi:hypothetical protein
VAKLHLFLLNRPLGDEVEVPPYGLFKNGKSYDIDDPELEQDITLGDPAKADEIPRFRVKEEDPNPGADQDASPSLPTSDPAPVKPQSGAGSDTSQSSAPAVPTVTEKPKEVS